jgi:hypothetical protein
MDFLSSLPIVGGYFDDTDEQALNELRKNQGLYNNVLMPDLNDYKPEELKYLGDFNPELMEATQVQEDPMLRSAQLDYLNQLSGLSKTGMSDVDALGYLRAQQIGAKQSRAGREAAMSNAQARGVGGSGLEFATREIANQEGAQRAQEAAMQQAADSARQRALYAQAYGGALSGVRSQDYGVNAKNTDILNQFNQMNTSNKNTAGMYNLSNRQDLSNRNISERNSAQKYNNDLRQQQFNNALTKAGGQAQANTGMASGYAAQNAANTAERNANTGILFGAYQALRDQGMNGAKKGGSGGAV